MTLFYSQEHDVLFDLFRCLTHVLLLKFLECLENEIKVSAYEMTKLMKNWRDKEHETICKEDDEIHNKEIYLMY